VVDDTVAKDENILFETPTSIYEKRRRAGQN
jgi:hypothetical protein